MILFLCGADSYRIKERIHVLEDAFRKKYDPNGMNLVRKHAKEVSPEEYRKLCLSSGLFSERRFVVVEEIEKASESLLSVLQETKIPDSSIVVLTSFTDGKKYPIFADKIEKFPIFSGRDLETWLERELQKRQVRMEKDAKDLFLSVGGSNLWKLSQEVEKLSHYKKNLSLQDVELMTLPQADDNIFRLTDALLNQNIKNCLEVLEDLLSSKVNEFQILSMLAWQLRVIWQVKETGGKGLALHPFVIRKVGSQAQKFSFERIQQLSSELVKLDAKLKRSQASAPTLLTVFLEKACLPADR